MAAPVVIDTDPGIDDALALLIAWSSPEISVEAVTTVAGNVPVEQGTVNVFRLLALRKPTPRPVIAMGAAEPLARPLVTAQRYHGEDGLGDLPTWPETEKPPREPDAVGVIIDQARRLQRLLTLVALGPLTNLALTLKADAGAVSLIGRIVAMGGAVDVPGNITPTAEYNMYVDPEAAHRVLAARLPLHLVPLDATRQAVLPRAGMKSALGRASGPLAERISAFSERGFRLDHATGSQGLVLHDPLALALAIDPTLAQWESVRLVIGPDGETQRTSGEPNCRIAKGVDTDRFLRLFLDRLCPPAPRRRASS
jgi:purine nucleosidase